MYLNKRGVFGTIVGLILLLLVLGILMYILVKIWAPAISEIADNTICKLSVIMKTKTKFFGKESPMSLVCSRIQMKISKNDNANEKLAKALYNCWWKMGGGKLDPFGEWGFFKGPVRCVVCSEIGFEEGVEVRGLLNYLSETKIPRKEITYAEYLNVKLEGVELIDTNRNYAVVFGGVKHADLFKVVKAAHVGLTGTALGLFWSGLGITGVGVGGAIGAVAGTIAGLTWTSELDTMLLLIPHEDIKKVCGEVEN